VNSDGTAFEAERLIGDHGESRPVRARKTCERLYDRFQVGLAGAGPHPADAQGRPRGERRRGRVAVGIDRHRHDGNASREALGVVSDGAIDRPYLVAHPHEVVGLGEPLERREPPVGGAHVGHEQRLVEVVDDRRPPPSGETLDERRTHERRFAIDVDHIGSRLSQDARQLLDAAAREGTRPAQKRPASIEDRGQRRARERQERERDPARPEVSGPGLRAEALPRAEVLVIRHQCRNSHCGYG
jgi:hypothetical protein